MPNDKQYLVINSPEPDDVGAYFLITTRVGPFGGGAQVVHTVDGLEHLGYDDSSYIRGYRHNGTDAPTVVVEFPAITPYIMIEKSRATFMTPEEAASTQRESDERFLKALRGDDKADPSAVPASGQYL